MYYCAMSERDELVLQDTGNTEDDQPKKLSRRGFFREFLLLGTPVALTLTSGAAVFDGFRRIVDLEGYMQADASKFADNAVPSKVCETGERTKSKAQAYLDLYESRYNANRRVNEVLSKWYLLEWLVGIAGTAWGLMWVHTETHPN